MTASVTTGDPGTQPFSVGDWIVEPALNRLRSGDCEVAIEPRLMALLTFLAARPGRPASKEDILAAVWGNVAATDESLSQAVFKLRRLLGDDPDQPLYIETIRKKGYRLIAPVAPLQQVSGSNRTWFAMVAGLGVILLAAFALLRQTESPAPSPRMLEARPITSSPGRQRDPSISPDGRYIVYTAANPEQGTQLFLHGIGKGIQDRQLTTREENSAPVFFPDGERIAFLRKSSDRCTVTMMTLVDGAERVLGDCNGNSYGDTAVSPDARWLAVSAREDPTAPHAIYLLDVRSGGRRPVTSPPTGTWGDYDAAFTADGTAIVFARSVSEGMQDVYAIDLNDGHEIRLTDDGKNIFGIAVGRDKVLFGSNRTGRYAIWSIGLDGKGMEQLPISSAGIVNPGLAADGSRLVVERIERTTDLNVIDLDGASRHETILSFNADILHPDFSAASGRIAFSSNRSGHYEVWDSDAAGQGLRRLTRFESGFTAHPKFSPNGQQIALDARPDGVSRIFVMYADGSGLRTLTGAESHAYSPTWSRDGRTIYFAKESNGTLEIWRHDFATGAIEPVTDTGGSYAIEGNGGVLYYVRPGRNGIWQPGTGPADPPRQSLSDPEAADWGNWTVADGAILYYDREDGALKIHNVESGTDALLATVAGVVPTADPGVAFDVAGQRAFVSIRRRLDSDLEIVDLSRSGSAQR